MTDSDFELVELRRRVAKLRDEARGNEAAWKRSQQRETTLLDAEDLPALLTELREGLRASYRLEASSGALADPDHEIRRPARRGRAGAGHGRARAVRGPRR